MYSESKYFPEISESYKGVLLRLDKDNIQHIFSDILYGDCAIAVFHDNHSNGKLDANVLGMPTERHGPLNKASSTFGAPYFSEAKFELNSNQTININLGN